VDSDHPSNADPAAGEEMKIIIASPGKEVKVSDEDYAYLNQFQWCCMNKRYPSPHRRITVNKQAVYVQLRHVVAKRMGLTWGSGQMVTHKNVDSLDNQRENLRIANKSQNACNGRMWSNNTSGAKGVCWDNTRKVWRAYIKLNQRQVWHRYFRDFDEAVQARADALPLFHGDFARTVVNEEK
jgi:hypothetical protein